MLKEAFKLCLLCFSLFFFEKAMTSILEEIESIEAEITQSSFEHNDTLNKFKNGKNLFITGFAGKGKTYLTKLLIRLSILRQKKIIVCGPTGQSVLQTATDGVCGSTLHSLLRLKPNEYNIASIIQNLEFYLSKRSKAVKKTYDPQNPQKIDNFDEILNCEIIFIDECSMMSAWMLEITDLIFRITRDKNMIMGGVQVIFIGDFLQLPPFGPTEITNYFCFKSCVWKLLQIEFCQLKRPQRQQDPEFCELLEKIAVSKNTSELDFYNNQILLKRSMQECPADCIEIMGYKKTVFETNACRYKLLLDSGSKELVVPFPIAYSGINESGEIFEEDINETRLLEKEIKEFLQIDYKANEQRYCIGARVMICVNLKSEKLINGSRGTITSFTNEKLPVVTFDDNTTKTVTPYCWKRSRFEYFTTGAFPVET